MMTQDELDQICAIVREETACLPGEPDIRRMIREELAPIKQDVAGLKQDVRTNRILLRASA